MPNRVWHRYENSNGTSLLSFAFEQATDQHGTELLQLTVWQNTVPSESWLQESADKKEVNIPSIRWFIRFIGRGPNHDHWTSSLEMSNKISMHLWNMLSNAGPPFSMRVGNMPRLQIINCTLWDPVAPGAVHRCLIFPSAQTGRRSFTRTSDLVQVVYTCAQALGTNRPPNVPVTWFPVNILRPVCSQRLCAGVPSYLLPARQSFMTKSHPCSAAIGLAWLKMLVQWSTTRVSACCHN